MFLDFQLLAGSLPSVSLCVLSWHLWCCCWWSWPCPLDGSGFSLPLDMSLLINLVSASFLCKMGEKILSLKDTEEEISEDQHVASPGFPCVF
jgi:hypothetical protein